MRACTGSARPQHVPPTTRDHLVGVRQKTPDMRAQAVGELVPIAFHAFPTEEQDADIALAGTACASVPRKHARTPATPAVPVEQRSVGHHASARTRQEMLERRADEPCMSQPGHDQIEIYGTRGKTAAADLDRESIEAIRYQDAFQVRPTDHGDRLRGKSGQIEIRVVGRGWRRLHDEYGRVDLWVE